MSGEGQRDARTAARALRPLVEEHAHGDDRPVATEVVAALRGAGWYGALSAQVRSTNAFVTEEAAAVVRDCYLLAGTTGLRTGPLERAFRDVHADTQHAMVNPHHHVEWARTLLADSG